MIEVYFVQATNPSGAWVHSTEDFFDFNLSEQKLTSIDFMNVEGQRLQISMFLDDWLNNNLIPRPTVLHSSDGSPYQIEEPSIDIWQYAIKVRKDGQIIFIGYLVDWNYSIDNTYNTIKLQFIDGISLMKRLGSRIYKNRICSNCQYSSYQTYLDNFIKLCARFDLSEETTIFDNIIYQYTPVLGEEVNNFTIYDVTTFQTDWEEGNHTFKVGFKIYEGELYFYFIKYLRATATVENDDNTLVYYIQELKAIAFKIINSIGIQEVWRVDETQTREKEYTDYSDAEIQILIDYFMSDEYVSEPLATIDVPGSIYRELPAQYFPTWEENDVTSYEYNNNQYNIDGTDVNFAGTIYMDLIRFKDNTSEFSVSDILGEIMKIHDIAFYVHNNDLHVTNKSLDYDSYTEISENEIIDLQKTGKMYRGDISFDDLNMPNIVTLKTKQVDELLRSIKYVVSFKSYLDLAIGNVYEIQGNKVKIYSKKITGDVNYYKGWQI